MSEQSIGERLFSGRIVVVVGCGGVGKTTVAAALGLAAARAGKRTLVLTIDPARRLADALGVELGEEVRAIPLGAESQGGSLSALMLDMKRTFDELVERFAESEEARQRILDNAIYQHVSDALAGSAEYAAMEKVYQVANSGDYDLIVVDTPPAKHALDFLEAPQRLVDFLDSRFVALLIHPAFSAGRLGVKLFQRSARRVLQLLEGVTGLAFLEDLSGFLLAFEGMASGFRDRAARVRSLLLGDESSFVLVTGPNAEALHHAEDFLGRLQSFELPLAGLVANRVRCWPGGRSAPSLRDPAAAQASLSSTFQERGEPIGTADSRARATLEMLASYAQRVRRDAASLAVLQPRAEALGCFLREIPELDADVHDLQGLGEIGRHLFATEPQRPDGSMEDPSQRPPNPPGPPKANAG